MRWPRRIARRPLLALLAVGLAACGSPPKTSYYTLGSATAAEGAVRGAATPSVAVGPVTVPEMVDRPQLVVRVSANEVALLDQHRWAEPLKTEVPRVLAANLSRLLGMQRVAAYPLQAAAEAEVRVRVDIQRFESLPGEAVLLEALWTVQGPKGQPPRQGRTLVRMAADGPGYGALAAAHARALERMSEELAEAIRNRSAG